MSFEAKTDHCGLGSVSGLEIKSSNLGKSGQFLEKNGAKGQIAATEYFGVVANPSCEYAMNGDVALSSVILGAGKVFETSHQVALATLSISTNAGDIPTVNASAVQIEDGTTHTEGTVCKYTLPSITLKAAAEAQDFGAFEITGANCELQSTTLEASVNIVTSVVNGVPKASDATQGKIVVTATIGKYGSTAPTVAAKTGWVQSAPLDCSDPDSDFPTYTASFEKILTIDVAQQ